MQTGNINVKTNCFKHTCNNDNDIETGFPLFYWQIQDFPGPPQKIFQDLFGAHECLNIKKKEARSPKGWQQEGVLGEGTVSPLPTSDGVWGSALSSHSGVRSRAPENLKFGATWDIKIHYRNALMCNFRGYFSRTFENLKLKFSGLSTPGPKWFSRTFQVLEF